MGDPMAPSEREGNSEGEGHEQAGRLGRPWRPWNERKDTNGPRLQPGLCLGLIATVGRVRIGRLVLEGEVG
jgi:hypothetical protein